MTNRSMTPRPRRKRAEDFVRDTKPLDSIGGGLKMPEAEPPGRCVEDRTGEGLLPRMRAGRRRVSLVIMLEPRDEVEMKLPGRISRSRRRSTGDQGGCRALVDVQTAVIGAVAPTAG